MYLFIIRLYWRTSVETFPVISFSFKSPASQTRSVASLLFWKYLKILKWTKHEATRSVFYEHSASIFKARWLECLVCWPAPLLSSPFLTCPGWSVGHDVSSSQQDSARASRSGATTGPSPPPRARLRPPQPRPRPQGLGHLRWSQDQSRLPCWQQPCSQFLAIITLSAKLIFITLLLKLSALWAYVSHCDFKIKLVAL